MIVGSLFDQKKQASQTGTSSGVLKPLISASAPVLQKQTPQSTSQPEVTVSKPKKVAEKATNFIASLKLDQLSLKKTKDALVAGAKMLPSQIKQAGGIIIQSVVNQQKSLDNFYQKTPKAVQDVLGNTPLFQASKVRATFPKVTEQANKKTEEFAVKLRNTGFEESKKKKEEYAKTYQPSEGLQKYLDLVAFNLPQVATSAVLTTGTALVTKSPALATAVGLSTSYGLGASEVYNEARAEGLSDKESLPLSQLGGVVIGALDFLPLGRLIRKSGSTEVIKKSIVKKIAQGIVSSGVQAGFEGITEGMQEIVGNAISSTYRENQDMFEGVEESVVVGALLGGMSDLTLDAVVGVTGGSPENINTKISEAINTPEEERSEEQKEIVKTLFTQELTSDELINYVTDNGLQDSEEGKSLVKTAYEAQQSNQNVRISLSDDNKSLNVELVSKDYIPQSVETETEGQKFDYQSTQLNLPKEQANTIREVSQKIPEEELYVEEGDRSFGREEEPHVTVLYGLENADTKKLKGIVESFNPIEVETKGISIFESEDSEYDVVKVDVEGEELRDLNSKIAKNFDTPGQTFKDYKPHITIAYVKKGMGQKYIDSKTLSGDKITIDKLSFMDKDGKAVEISLIGKETSRKTEKSKSRKVDKSTKKSKKKTFRAKSVPRQQLPQGEGEKRVSRLEARVKKVLENVSEEQIDKLGLATYKQLSKEENIQKAVEYVSNNPEEALQVLAGEKDAPKGILNNAIYIAMERLAKGDLALARRLASLSSTRMGQEISILTELDPESTVKLMRDIIQVREKAFQARYKGKTATQAKESVIKDIKASIKKPDRADWSSFLKEIEC